MFPFSENINLFEATIMEQPLSMQEVGGEEYENVDKICIDNIQTADCVVSIFYAIFLLKSDKISSHLS